MNLRWSRVLLGYVGMLIVGVSSAHATATTHIWAPSTDVQSFKVMHITSDLYLPVEHDGLGARIATVTNLGLTVGVLPFRVVQLELGFDHKSGLGTLDDHPLYGNAKLGMLEGALGKAWPAIALGVFDVGTKSGKTDDNVLYVKVAKSFSHDSVSFGRISLGYFSGNDDLLLGPDGLADAQGVLLAWERTIPELSDKLWFCVEYMGSNSAYGTANVGAAWKFTPELALLVGYSKFNNEELASTATAQVDIDF